MPPRCPKCSRGMQEGFLLDRGDSGNRSAEWVQGMPEKSIWVGMKMRGRERLPVSAHRCESCGYVELFARAPEGGE